MELPSGPANYIFGLAMESICGPVVFHSNMCITMGFEEGVTEMIEVYGSLVDV